MPLLKNTKNQLTFLIAILLLLSPFFLFLNTRYYIDPLNLGFIKIDRDVLRGNSNTIKKAIKRLKKEDQESYRILTKYINRISEKHCIIADHKLDQEKYVKGLKLPACYIKGSKTIYLRPEKDNLETTIKARSKNIKELSLSAKNFWDNYQK